MVNPRIVSAERHLLNKIENARRSALCALLQKHFDPLPATEQEVELCLQKLQNAEVPFDSLHEKDLNRCMINPGRDAFLCFQRIRQRAYEKQKYSAHKAKENEAYRRKQEAKKKYEAVRNEKARQVRAKISSGEALSVEEENTKRRLEQKKEFGNKIVPRTAKEIQRDAAKIAAKNCQPGETAKIEAQLLPLIGQPAKKYYQAKRKLDHDDKDRERERDKKPRRVAKKRIATYLRKKKLLAAADKTIEERKKLAADKKERRNGMRRSSKWPRKRALDEVLPEAEQRFLESSQTARRILLEIKRKNARFQASAELNLECDEFAFVREVITFMCSYCGCEPAGGLDRLNSAECYHLANIVPCCTDCNTMKNVLSPQHFIGQATKIREHVNSMKLISDKTTKEEKACVYCGAVERVGIDRVDHTIRDYANKDNCVPCCSLCNYMKKTFSLEKFLSHIELISDSQLEKNKSCVQQLQIKLLEEHRQRPKLKPRKASTVFAKGRAAEENKVCVIGNNHVYHTITDHSKVLCLQGEFKSPKKFMTACEALQSCHVPCRICRKTLCDDEFELWTNSDCVKTKTIQNVTKGLVQRLGAKHANFRS